VVRCLISYSQSNERTTSAVALYNKLRLNGIDARIDAHRQDDDEEDIKGLPLEDWIMLSIERATYILILCDKAELVFRKGSDSLY